MKPTNVFLLLLEKVGWTYVQALLALLIVHDTIGADTLQIVAIAAIPAALTALVNGLPGVSVGLPLVLDLALRTMRTYLVTFVGLLLAMPVFHLNFTVAVAAATGALPAALAVIKGGIASQFGNGSPATLPSTVDPPALAAA